MTAGRRFVFCDIDGTLLHARGAGAEAFGSAFEEVYGVPADLSKISFAGATDKGVIAKLLRNQQIEPSSELEARFFKLMPGLLDEYLADNPPDVFPGVAKFLEQISTQWGLGLITGNIKSCAFIKLKHAGIDHFFDVGGYGDDHDDRTQIAVHAIKRAGHPEQSLLLGDTPSDIRAAKANGLVAVAVCTGGFKRNELEAAGADHVLSSLEPSSELSDIFKI